MISAGSVGTDTETLRDLYWHVGITEYWLVDARTDRLIFTIVHHAPGGYVAGRKQAGWSKSRVLGRSFRLTCQADAAGNPDYTLATR